MSVLAIRPALDCRYDAVSLGEVMLRLDPGEGRIRTARHFSACEGGGEYNVARGLSRAFGLRAAIVTALADNEIGHLIEELIQAGGVDTHLIEWFPHDGVGRAARNGLNFTERGFGVRGALGVSDRGHTAASQLRADQVDFDELFGTQGVRWLHTGGIYAALSDTAADTTMAAVRAAQNCGVVVSYDLNYRPSLWQAVGGRARAQAVNRAIAPYVDVMIGNEEDFTAALGFTVPGTEPDLARLETDAYAAMIDRLSDTYPNLRVIATTLRTVRSATVNDWGALAWSESTGLVEASFRPGLDILDRVGGGDSFASGLIAALLEEQDLQTAVEWGAAHGALAMTTPGDTSMAARTEILKLAGGGSARVER
ncbi:MAG TPA: sugar kinase [Cellulomonas sp.]